MEVPASPSQALVERLGPEPYERRRKLEDRPERGHHGIVSRSARLLRAVFKASGLYGLGQGNALNFSIEEYHWTLPVARPLTLLQLSDLHYLPDERHPLPEALAAALADMQWDICVLTGDYRFPVRGDNEPALAGLLHLRDAIPGPIYAVLGNHDSLEIVEPAEASGIRFLLNESIEATPGLWFVGVDDPAQYRTDDLERAVRQLPPQADTAAKVMLAHDCSGYREAAAAGIHLQLSGHSHGGQICLPGGFPLLHNLRAPRHMNKGSFEYQGMHGHVSRGTGSCGVDIRFFCPPEISLHHLEPSPSGKN